MLLKLTLASFEAFLYQRRIRCKYEMTLLFVDKRHVSEDEAESLLRVLVSAVCYNRTLAKHLIFPADVIDNWVQIKIFS